jgi:hypothetical protein
MAKVIVNTDTSLTFDPETHVLELRLSPKEDNILDFNTDNELSLKDLTKFAHIYYPMNGIVGEANKALSEVQCDSSCTRLTIYDESAGNNNDGAIWDGMVGDPDHEGINVVRLCEAIMSTSTGSTVSMNVTWWSKEHYRTREVESGGEWPNDT